LPQASGGGPPQDRLARPIRADAEVIENRAEGGQNLRLRLRVAGWPGFLPGQFVMLSPGARTSVERSDPLLPRPMAIYRTRDQAGGAEVEILYKRVGRGTCLLAETLPGQSLRLVGPLGRPFPAPAHGERALLVAGGTGIASVYQLAAALRSSDCQLLLGARSAADLMGEGDFAALGVPLRIATEDGSRGERGLVTALLERALAETGQGAEGAAQRAAGERRRAPAKQGAEGAAQRAAGERRRAPAKGVRVYTCGPTPMMARVAQLAAAAGHPCVVSLENHMACGFGVCLGCAAPLAAGGYALVCRDGPAFEAGQIAWQGMP
jgi:dihydroorotate dehydrogenase electron transfer subunit